MEMLPPRREDEVCIKTPLGRFAVLLRPPSLSLLSSWGDISVLPQLAETGFEDLELRRAKALDFNPVQSGMATTDYFGNQIKPSSSAHFWCSALGQHSSCHCRTRGAPSLLVMLQS